MFRCMTTFFCFFWQENRKQVTWGFSLFGRSACETGFYQGVNLCVTSSADTNEKGTWLKVQHHLEIGN